jgi:glycosyltransferase involved in cell wall biosynthesis
MVRSTAATPAAMRWSNGFLSGLEANGVSYCHVGHEPARAWPYGPLRLQASSREGRNPTIGVTFTNLPWIRYRSLARAYRRAAADAECAKRPDLIVTYNAEPHEAAAARSLVAKGVPWIPIVMDGDDRSLDSSWRGIEQAVHGSAGIALLSYWAMQQCPLKPKLHIDGGIEARFMADRHDRQAPAVLYTGTKGPWGGVDLLLDAWQFVRHDQAQLWICGQGAHKRLHEAASRDGRITDFGVVPEAQLQSLMEQAALLVNPRPPAFPGNRLNFPSKLLEYLSTGKPVVSTRTASLSPAYDAVLQFPVAATPVAFAEAIDEVLRWSDRDRALHRERVGRFAAEHGDWQAITARFLEWAATIVRGGAGT